MYDRNKIFELKQRIRSYNANEARKSSAVALIDFFNDAAWEHSRILEIGTDRLLLDNKNWVLYDMKFQFFEFPKWNEDILIRTWASGVNRIFATREVEIYSSSSKSNLIASGTSSWFIIDLATRRPMRPDIYDIMRNSFLYERVEIEFSENISMPENMVPISQITARYSELDWNGHVNNSHYIKWLYDVLGRDYHKNYKVNALHIRFLSEVLYSQNVQIFANSDVFSGKSPSFFRYLNTSTNKISAEVEIISSEFFN